MKEQDPGDVTRLLQDWRRGDSGALNKLTQLVHDELHRIAHGFMRGERSGHTLQTTALVNEAYVRLVGADVPIKDRTHFKSLAASAMRRILVDNARGHSTAPPSVGASP